jgi:hypothetical protein
MIHRVRFVRQTHHVPRGGRDRQQVTAHAELVATTLLIPTSG